MKLFELCGDDHSETVADFKDHYDKATDEMISRIKSGEDHEEVIRDLSRKFASMHNDSYDMFSIMSDGLKKRHWEMGFEAEKEENEPTPIAISVAPADDSVTSDFKKKDSTVTTEKAPPGREKQVKKLKKKFDDPGAAYAIAWAQHNKHGKPKKEAVKEGESLPRLLGKAEASLMHGLQLAGDVLADDHSQAKVRAEIIKQNWPGLIEDLKNAYKTNEDEASDRAQQSIWRKSNPIGNNFMNPDDYDSDAPGTHIIMNNPTELHFYKVPAKNYDEAFDLWLNDSATRPEDNQYYDSTKDYASDHQYWGRIAPEEQEPEESIQSFAQVGKNPIQKYKDDKDKKYVIGLVKKPKNAKEPYINKKVKSEDGMQSADLKRMGLTKNKVYVHKDGKTIMVDKSIVRDMLKVGWKLSHLRVDSSVATKEGEQYNMPVGRIGDLVRVKKQGDERDGKLGRIVDYFTDDDDRVYTLVFDDESETDKHDTSPSFGNNEENYELGHLEFLDQTVDRRDYAQPEESLDEKMPASIIKHKQKLAMMTDKELADRLGSFDETKLRQMAWRHGYGKMSSYYWDRVQVGKKDVSKYKEGDMIGVNWNWYSISQVEDGNIWATDKDGSEHQINPSDIETHERDGKEVAESELDERPFGRTQKAMNKLGSMVGRVPGLGKVRQKSQGNLEAGDKANAIFKSWKDYTKQTQAGLMGGKELKAIKGEYYNWMAKTGGNANADVVKSWFDKTHNLNVDGLQGQGGSVSDENIQKALQNKVYEPETVKQFFSQQGVTIEDNDLKFLQQNKTGKTYYPEKLDQIILTAVQKSFERGFGGDEKNKAGAKAGAGEKDKNKELKLVDLKRVYPEASPMTMRAISKIASGQPVTNKAEIQALQPILTNLADMLTGQAKAQVRSISKKTAKGKEDQSKKAGVNKQTGVNKIEPTGGTTDAPIAASKYFNSKVSAFAMQPYVKVLSEILKDSQLGSSFKDIVKRSNKRIKPVGNISTANNNEAKKTQLSYAESKFGSGFYDKIIKIVSEGIDREDLAKLDYLARQGLVPRNKVSRFKTAMRTLAKGKDIPMTYKNDVIDVVVKLAGIITKPGVLQMVRRGLSAKGKK